MEVEQAPPDPTNFGSAPPDLTNFSPNLSVHAPTFVPPMALPMGMQGHPQGYDFVPMGGPHFVPMVIDGEQMWSIQMQSAPPMHPPHPSHFQHPPFSPHLPPHPPYSPHGHPSPPHFAMPPQPMDVLQRGMRRAPPPRHTQGRHGPPPPVQVGFELDGREGPMTPDKERRAPRGEQTRNRRGPRGKGGEHVKHSREPGKTPRAFWARQYKTKPCRRWHLKTPGECDKGAACFFSHGPGDVSTAECPIPVPDWLLEQLQDSGMTVVLGEEEAQRKPGPDEASQGMRRKLLWEKGGEPGMRRARACPPAPLGA